ncbi:MAG: glycosyltransferase family 2 protein [Patescibacteria group bacterium]
MKVSIIIPVFNEQNTISKIIDLVKKSRLPKDFKKEIIVVDDASTDLTPGILKKQRNIKLITHSYNQGKGAAIKTALNQAKGDIILIQDADLEYSPSDYSKLLSPFISPPCQAVYGTRLANYPLVLTGPNKTPLPIHWLTNHLLSALTRLLYGGSVSDMETCYKVVRTKLIKDFRLTANRFDFEPEITAKLLKRGVSIVEVPITVTPRTYSEGKKIGWRDGLSAIYTLFRYRFQD